MIFNGKGHSGAVTTEVAIGIALATVVLFVALGLFNDNIQTVIKSSGFTNVFSADNKSTFSTENPDYSDSQINVQLTGDQGVLLIRKKANNWALDLISESFTPSNGNGNTIGYLATIVEVISGSPDICTRMEDESEETCDKLDGYKYKINSINGSKISVSETESSGKAIKTIDITIDSAYATLLNNVSSLANANDKRKVKFDKIRDLSKKSKPQVSSGYLLLLNTTAEEAASGSNPSTGNSSDSTLTYVKNKAILTIKSILESVYQAYQGCRFWNFKDGWTTNAISGGCDSVINQNDYTYITEWGNKTIVKIENAKSVQEVEKIMNEAINDKSITDRLDDDVITDSRDTSCDTRNEQIDKLNYQTSLTVENTTSCKSESTK